MVFSLLLMGLGVESTRLWLEGWGSPKAAPSPPRLLGNPEREGSLADGRCIEPLTVLQGHKGPEDELVAWPLGRHWRSHTRGLQLGRPTPNLRKAC